MAQKHFHKSAWDNPLDYIFKTAKDVVLGWGPGRKMTGGAVKKKKNLDRDQENLHVEGNTSEKRQKADVSGRQCLVSNHTIGGQKMTPSWCLSSLRLSYPSKHYSIDWILDF